MTNALAALITQVRKEKNTENNGLAYYVVS